MHLFSLQIKRKFIGMAIELRVAKIPFGLERIERADL